MLRGVVLFLIVFVEFSEIYSAPAEVDNSKKKILSNEYNLNPDDSYNYEYKLSDREYAHVEGKLNDDGSRRIKGIYYFDGPDGKLDITCFIADENGAEAGAVIVPTNRKPLPPVHRGNPANINPRTIVGAFG